MIDAQLAPDANYETWRVTARALLSADVPPENIAWTCDAPDLLAESAPLVAEERPLTVPRAFVDIAEHAILHIDASRFGLLYRVLWRLQRNKALLDDPADADVARLHALAKAVRRDIHKMHAFVRFKEVNDASGPCFVAWFEPLHHITRAAADFFVKRFAGMRWSIVTPEASAHWDGDALCFGPGGRRADVPAEDARDDDWRTYYAAMFNPARVRPATMTREMPKHYRRNLPEAALIDGLIREALTRAEDMIAAMPTISSKRAGAAVAKIMPEDLPARLEQIAEHGEPPHSLADLKRALSACRACSLWRDATQAVPGEGPSKAPLLALVGEQPGDQEDLAGHPFVGPAGQVLNRALEAAGIERGEIFVTPTR